MGKLLSGYTTGGLSSTAWLHRVSYGTRIVNLLHKSSPMDPVLFVFVGGGG
jgi:hypothetical protein